MRICVLIDKRIDTLFSLLFKVHPSSRPDFTSKLVHGLAFGTPKFYIVPYDKINRCFVNLSHNCNVKSRLRLENRVRRSRLKICHYET